MKRGSDRERGWRARLGLLGAAAIMLVASSATGEARNLALVVGNDDYAHVATLKTAVGDARAVAQTLEKIGFVVRRAENVDRDAMNRALEAFDASVQPGDRALFFYSGHGFEISGAELSAAGRRAGRPEQPIRTGPRFGRRGGTGDRGHS